MNVLKIHVLNGIKGFQFGRLISLKSGFSLMHETSDDTDDFCKPDWLVQKGCIFKCLTKFDLVFWEGGGRIFLLEDHLRLFFFL